jgi:TRAP-type C4-dicarboxylate transport system substrate-binding protein
MKKGIAISVLMVVVLVGLIPGCAKPVPTAEPTPTPVQEVIKWKCTTNAGAGNPMHSYHQFFVDRVAEMTGGRIEIELIPVGELYPLDQYYDMVGKGVSEMTANWPGFLGGINPAYKIGDFFPGVDVTWDMWMLYLDEMGHLEHLREMLARGNIHLIDYFIMTPCPIISNVPIRKASDFEGVKFRAFAIVEEMMTKLGCSCVFVTPEEVYTGLQLGTFDAAKMGCHSLNYAMGLHEITDYIIEPCFSNPLNSGAYMVNMDAWNDLSPELQAVMRGAAKVAGIQYGLAFAKEDNAAKRAMIDYGVEVITLPPEEMAIITKKAREVWHEMAQKNEDCAKMVEQFEATLELLGYEM